jgi:transketolase
MSFQNPTLNEIRQWNRLGPRGTYGQAILSLAETFPNLIAMSADLGNSSGLDRFRSSYPDRFINVGIAEQNLVGVASGVSRSGFNVFASSFSPFIAMRASEQVRMNLGYMQEPVNLVAIGSGLSMGFLGNSHFGIEDAAVMRSIPSMRVVSPADCLEIVKVLEACLINPAPTYIRLTGGPNNIPAYSEDYDFEFSKAVTMRQGTDLAVVATGSMVARSMQAAEILDSEGISIEIINMHTIKPLDEEIIRNVAARHKIVITVEEHSVIGGLGSAVAECLVELESRPKFKAIGLPDLFGPTGDYEYLLNHYGLTGEKLAVSIKALLEEKLK